MFNVTLKENYDIVKDFINPSYNPKFSSSEEASITSSLLPMSRQTIISELQQNVCRIDVWNKYIPAQPAPHLPSKPINSATEIRKMIQDLLLERYSYLVAGNSGNRRASSSSVSSLVRQIFKIVMIKETGDLYIYNFRHGLWEPGSLPIKRLIYELVRIAMQLEWSSLLEKKINDEIGRKVPVIEWKDFNQKGFPFMNMTLDYQTLTMHEHDPSYFSTIKSDVSYDPNASCPTFKNMLEIWFKNETDTQLFVQEWYGYCLAGGHQANVFLLVYSKGGEGKSTFFGVLENLIGQINSSAATLGNLNTDFGLEPLVGKKVNISTESGSSAFNTSKLKAITAGEKITVNRKNMAETDMILPAKLIFLLNELPQLSDDSRGFARRLLILPFLHVLPPDKQDKHLAKRLNGELSGILNWALEGLQRLQSNNYNFTVSTSMRAIQNLYHGSSNVMKLYIKNRIVIDNNPINKVAASAFITDFIQWASGQNLQYVHLASPKKFWTEFEKNATSLGIGYIKSKSNGRQVVKGIRIQ
ncbi:DNA primase family protein [Macrococcus brunensis]|uniref:DNA primase family protein n=1 Tax=Macrococcus brunensis TaxID=198483 RepID=UPI001EEFBEE2|nr:phage/plasmid primase, P4 family [Macrococcus brunensis]ULG74231.1 phage/plasmid primase, P4 family [Macrococcus brunensis]